MAGETNPKPQGNLGPAQWGHVPIGTILPWTNHLAGTPKVLPQEYVQCAGQTITDTASPMKGQTVPNLGSGGGGTNFLSGSTASGNTGGGANLTVSLNTTNLSFFANSTSTTSTPVNFNPTVFNSTSATAAFVPPAYYTVIYCMRIK